MPSSVTGASPDFVKSVAAYGPPGTECARWSAPPSVPPPPPPPLPPPGVCGRGRGVGGAAVPVDRTTTALIMGFCTRPSRVTARSPPGDTVMPLKTRTRAVLPPPDAATTSKLATIAWATSPAVSPSATRMTRSPGASNHTSDHKSVTV